VNPNPDKAWRWLDSVVGPFYPPGIRRFLTLGWITAFVVAVFILAFLGKLALPHLPLSPLQSQIEHELRRPIFIVPYELAMLLAIWLLIRCKPRAEYHYLRALLYGMFLAGFLGSFLVLLMPWRG
jgi:hypothetical protein